MSRFPAVKLLAAACIAMTLTAASAAAQTKTPPPKPPAMGGMDYSKMDGGKMEDMEHAGSGWKELDAYHQLMMGTWHPANGKNDLAPTRAKAVAMAEQANVLGKSIAPKGCDTPALKAAVTKLVPETQALANMVAAKADDTALKSALKALHAQFEVLEMGCKPSK